MHCHPSNRGNGFKVSNPCMMTEKTLNPRLGPLSDLPVLACPLTIMNFRSVEPFPLEKHFSSPPSNEFVWSVPLVMVKPLYTKRLQETSTAGCPSDYQSLDWSSFASEWNRL